MYSPGMPDILGIGTTCLTWGCNDPAIVRNYCGACYQVAWRSGDLKIKRVTVSNRKKGRCKKCKRTELLTKVTDLCRKCHKQEWAKTPKARATQRAYDRAHREESRKRSTEHWRKNSEKKNANRKIVKRFKEQQLARPDANAIRWRRPSWFYEDDRDQRIAWSFAFDKSFAEY